MKSYFGSYRTLRVRLDNKDEWEETLIDEKTTDVMTVITLFLSGPSEEILFRALPIAVYMHYMNEKSKADSWIAIILSSLLFAIAHIDLVYFTFSWFQVLYAFVLGIVYGLVLRKTKSIIYPMIMHSMSNVISVGGCYIYMALIR